MEVQFVCCGIPIIMMVVAFAIVIAKKAMHQSTKRDVLHSLKQGIPAGFVVTDEHFGEDGATAALLDRNAGRVIFWQGSLSETRIYSASAIRAVEYCEDGNTVSVGIGAGALGAIGIGAASSSSKVKMIHLRIEIDDLDNPFTTLCFLKSEINFKRDHPAYVAASENARKWKARVEVMRSRATPGQHS